MNVEIGLDEIRNKIIIFQKKGYQGYAIYRYIVEHVDKVPAEIFPGIFLSLKEERGIKKWIKLLKCKEYRSVVFEIQNIRDRFEVIERESRRGEWKREKSITKKEEIFPNDISYPNNLGGGYCRGCRVTSYFSGLVMTGTYDIIRDADIVEQTKLEPYFVSMCKASECHKTYQIIEKQGYRYDLPECNMIHIDVRNGKYIPTEGKHRVCAMKRYDYSQKILARITYTGECDSDFYFLVDYCPSERDLTNYYKCFEAYGLNEKLNPPAMLGRME